MEKPKKLIKQVCENRIGSGSRLRVEKVLAPPQRPS